MAASGNSIEYNTHSEQQQRQKENNINKIPSPQLDSNEAEERRQTRNALRRLKAQQKQQNKSEFQRQQENSVRRLKAQQKRQSKTESQRKSENAAKALKAKQKEQSKTESQRQARNAELALKAQQKQQNKSESQRQQENSVRRLKAQQKRQSKTESQRKSENAAKAFKAKQKEQSKTESQRQARNAELALKAQQKKQSKPALQRQHENLLRRLKAQQKEQNKTESQRLNDNAAKALKAKQNRKSKTESQRQIINTARLLKSKEKQQRDQANENSNFETLKQQYDTKMKTWPSQACEFCDRMMYPIGLKGAVLQENNIETLASYNIDGYVVGSKVSLCHTCYDHLKKHKMSSQSKHNLMIVPPTPSCISSLTNMELRLISQVKLHLQIFKLCYYGQYGMKGTALHFPQAVSEISHQLPLTTIQSEVVVVAETLEAVKSKREFQIRPEFINQALLWLKQNNVLYKDIVIQDRSQDEMSLENIVVITQPTLSIAATSNYVPKGSYEYLQGTILNAQSNHQFFAMYGGKQCTANCAAFIAHSSVQNVVSFSANTIDKILIDGDRYYGNILQDASESKKEEIEGNFGYLHTDDIAGDFKSPNLDVIANLTVHNDEAVSLNGVLKKGRNFKFNGYNINLDVPTLESAIQHFLALEIDSCVLTTASYSMAICKQEDNVFYFDPHCRTATGRVCTTGNGLAIILKFPLESAANKIAALVHLNVQPKETTNNIFISDLTAAEKYKTNYIQKFAFAICLVLVTHHNISGNISQAQSNLNINEHIFGQQDLGFGLPQHSEHIDPSSIANVECNISCIQTQGNKTISTFIFNDPFQQDLGFGLPQRFERIGPISIPNVDCNNSFQSYADNMDTYFLHTIDYNEPEIEQFVQNLKRGSSSNPMQLHRTTGPPIKSYLEKHLEELSFVSLFPHGTHGFNDNRRKIKQSPLKYFQARIMSSDARFHTKEYLCYALDRIEQFKIEQQIGIVCNMKPQGGQNAASVLIPGAHNPHLYLKAIRGGASYWKQFGGDVFAMVNMLSIPTFWLTFSTDDLNCSELMQAIWKATHGNDSEFSYENLSPEQRKQMLDNNPVLAARYFCTKVKQILAVLEKDGELLFGRKVINHIGRIEFQARGSGHYHMMIWCENTPDFNTEEGISFINNNVSVSLDSDIKDLVKRYQIHHHTQTCFKNNKTRVCRFNFPRKVAADTEILSKEETHRNHGRSVQYARKTDEINVNNYHPKLLQLIRSNMDIQVVGDVNDVIFYIAKYISKAEPEKLSADLQNALVTAKSSTSENIRRNLINVANVVTRHRQIGCPEVAFRVLGLPLRFCSKSFQFVAAYKKETRLRMIQKERLRENKTIICMNIIERYELRPDTEEMRQMCLYEFAAHFDPKKSTAYDDVDEEMEEDFEIIDSALKQKNVSIQLLNNKGVMIKRKNPKVIKYPTFNKETQQEDYYYSLLLMYLPFRSEDDILTGYPSSSAAFLAKRSMLRTNDNASVCRFGLQEEVERAVLRLREDVEHQGLLQSTNLNCNNEPEEMDVPDENPLPPPNLLQAIDTRTSTFSTEQKLVYDLVRQQIQKDKNSCSTPLRLFVSGEGGTGKSYVIQTLTMFIRNMLHGIGDPLQIAAPTACAAIPISGMTLHRSFGIPVENSHTVPPYTKLTAKTLQNYRQRYRHLRWIILDEVSMISYETFEYINRRLQDIFQSMEPFANINILLFGDILQLKPCNGNWIYKHPTSMIASTDLWRLFSFVELKVNHRQSGTDPLKQICSRLRIGTTTAQDISHLMTRVLGKESTWNSIVKNEWQDVIRIFPTNKLANSCNESNIQDLQTKGIKIYTVNAVDTFADGVDAGRPAPPEVIPTSINKTSGIPNQIQIGISVRIMLRCNLSVDDKLVNGSRGAIKGIKWPRLLTDQSYDGQLPESISVLFDDPTAGGHLKDKATNLVCIKPRLFDFAGKRNKINRMMLPCILVAGITCHKVQGQTVSRAVIQLKGWNIFKGGAYVALSRCTSLKGLAITEIDTAELIPTDKFCPAEKSSIEEYKRLAALPQLI